MSSTGNRYSNEFKQQLVELNQSGSSVSKLSREYGIPTGTIYKWIKDFTPVITEDGKAVTPKEIKAFINWIRKTYFFPIRINLIIKPCKFFVDENNRNKSKADLYYFNDTIQKSPFIWIATGYYTFSKKNMLN